MLHGSGDVGKKRSPSSAVAGSLIILVATIEYVGSLEDVVRHSFLLCAAVKDKVFFVEGFVQLKNQGVCPLCISRLFFIFDAGYPTKIPWLRQRIDKWKQLAL